MTHTLWLKNISEEIFETLSLSDKGTLPPFPFEKFSKNIEKRFGKKISIAIENIEILSAENFYQGLGKKTLTSPLTFQNIDHNFYFTMGMNDVELLLSYMENTKEDNSIEPLIIEDESLIKGLYTYIITEAIDAIMELDTYKNLSLKISEGLIQDLFAKSIDISIKLPNKKILARFLIPESFNKAIHSHFNFIPPTLENLEQIPNIQIPMSITTGSITLCQNEINELELGDFLIFHNSFYKPNDQKRFFSIISRENPSFSNKTTKRRDKNFRLPIFL